MRNSRWANWSAKILEPFHPLTQTSLNFVQIYPIWLCPCRFFNYPGLARLPKDSASEDEMYIDIGIYGASPKTKNFNIETNIRKLEKFTTECNGYEKLSVFFCYLEKWVILASRISGFNFFMRILIWRGRNSEKCLIWNTMITSGESTPVKVLSRKFMTKCQWVPENEDRAQYSTSRMQNHLKVNTSSL